MDSKQIDKTFANYNKYSLWIIVALTFVILIAQNVFFLPQSIVPMVAITVIFSLVTSLAYSVCWRSIAKSSPLTLAKFYLAASVLRMMIGVLVVAAYCIVVGDRAKILTFAVVFLSCYFIMLIFDGAYFAHIEKRNNK